MGIKEKTLNIGGKDVVIRQLTFGAQLRLEELGSKRTITDIYKECIKNFAVLEELSVDEGLQLIKEITDLNGWANNKDFQQTP